MQDDAEQIMNQGSIKNQIAEAKKKEKSLSGKMWFVTNSEAEAKIWSSFTYTPIKDASIVGVSGGIMAHAIFMRQAVVALFAPINQFAGGSHAAITLIKGIDKYLGNDVIIDTKELSTSANNMDKKLQKLLEKLPFGGDASSETPPESMYM